MLDISESLADPGIPVILRVGVVLGPVWDRYTNSRSGPRTSLGPLH